MSERITSAELQQIADALSDLDRPEHPMPERLRDAQPYDDYGHDDITRALVAEVRRLRGLIRDASAGDDDGCLNGTDIGDEADLIFDEERKP